MLQSLLRILFAAPSRLFVCLLPEPRRRLLCRDDDLFFAACVTSILEALLGAVLTLLDIPYFYSCLFAFMAGDARGLAAAILYLFNPLFFIPIIMAFDGSIRLLALSVGQVCGSFFLYLPWRIALFLRERRRPAPPRRRVSLELDRQGRPCAVLCSLPAPEWAPPAVLAIDDEHFQLAPPEALPDVWRYALLPLPPQAIIRKRLVWRRSTGEFL